LFGAILVLLIVGWHFDEQRHNWRGMPQLSPSRLAA
jgi:hypothetical protein